MSSTTTYVLHRTESTPRKAYKGTIDSFPNPIHLVADLVLCVSASKTRLESRVMLARVRSSGRFELLTAAAWARALGYQPVELSGKLLRELMPDQRRASELAAALLDQTDAQPFEVVLRCKNEQRKRFRFYRRFDAYEEAVFVFADEVTEDAVAPVSASA